MKKKICTSLMVFFLMFMMTGCVKFNASMDIKKDKSMDFKIIYAFDTTYFGDEELLEEADKVKLEEEGFTVTDYSDGSMKGFTMSKNIKNIDNVSSTNDTEYSLSGVVESADNDEYLFKVKKGLLKNKYTAKLNFDSSDSSLNDSSDTEKSDEDIDLDLEDDYELEDDSDMDFDFSLDDEELDEETESDSGDTDFDFDNLSSGMSSMDLSFNVTLPYAAISNNATTVSDDGKTLKWELTTDDASSIEFEFELYNMTNIYVGVGLLVALVVIVIVIMSKGKGKKTLDSGNVSTQNIQNNMEQNIGRDVYQASLQSVENSVQTTASTITATNTVQSTPVAPVMDIPVVEQPSTMNFEAPVQNPVNEVVQSVENVQSTPVVPVMNTPVVEQPSVQDFEEPKMVEPIIENSVKETIQPVVTPVVEPSQVILDNQTETLDVNSDNQNMN